MEDINQLLPSLRNLYARIYNWHRKHGIDQFEKRHGEVECSERRLAYFDLLERMPSPEIADLESIGVTARAVSCGCMEWSYGQSVGEDWNLGTIARQILKLLEEIEEKSSDQEREESLRALQNIGSECGPSCVDVVLREGAFNEQEYSRYASIAYSDVGKVTNLPNVGGEVALSDTNLEQEMHCGAHKHKIRFRNAAALHFTQDRERDSIVSLALSGTISVVSVTIGAAGERRR